MTARHDDVVLLQKILSLMMQIVVSNYIVFKILLFEPINKIEIKRELSRAAMNTVPMIGTHIDNRAAGSRIADTAPV